MKLTSLIIILLLIMSSCIKELPNTARKLTEVEAVDSLRKIVGNTGVIKVLSNSKNSGVVHPFSIVDSNVKLRILSLSEFKKVYSNFDLLLVNSKGVLLRIDTVNAGGNIKSYSLKGFDIYDTLAPGSYTFRISPNLPGIDYNGNSSYLTFMNVFFEIGSDRSVVGSPQITYTGINLFSWNQVATSTNYFDPLSNTSTFTIAGSVLFGIQIGGFTLGWSRSHYIGLVINPDADKPVFCRELNF